MPIRSDIYGEFLADFEIGLMLEDNERACRDHPNLAWAAGYVPPDILDDAGEVSCRDTAYGVAEELGIETDSWYEDF